MASARRFLVGGSINAAATDAGLLILRVYAGLALALAHGYGKLPPSPRFIEGVGALGFPLPLVFAWAAALAEFAGGILLALGLATRPAALFIAITMATAGFLAHASDPFNVKEKPLLFLAVAVLFLLAGAGRYSIDALLRKR
jgi:putative oxidoreductase